MLTALKALGGKFASWVTGEGARTAGSNFGKQLAVNQVSKNAMKGYGAADNAVHQAMHGTPNPSNNMNEMIDRGHRKVGGFWGGVAISVVIGVGVSFLVPGAGVLAVGLVQGIGTNLVEGAIGVMAGEDEPTPAPTPEPTEQPVEENLPPVSGTDPEPAPVQEPEPTTFIYVDPGTTSAPHEEPEPDPDPHEECCAEADPDH